MAALSYTTGTAIKTAANISDTNSDTRLSDVATAVNEWVESYVGAPVGPAGTALRTFDHEGGKVLHIRQGVQGVTTLEYAVSTAAAQAGTYTAIATGNYVVRPASHDRPTGWPAFDIILVDGSTPSRFPAGYDVVRVTPSGGFGWAAIPADLSRVALIAALRMFQSSQSGEVLTIGTNDFGAAIVRFLPEPEYQAVLERYRTVVSPSWTG